MELIDFILHVDKHLETFIQNYNTGVYVLLFLIVFVETGLVVMPFLPGDSLLFAVGMLAAKGFLSIELSIGLMFLAAFLGDNCNYFMGKYFGEKIVNFKLFGKTLVKQAYIDKTQAYYDQNGAQTVIIARFIPIVRTFAPFVAGVGKMPYFKFLKFSLIGAVLWVVGISLAGYFLGSIPIVKENFEKVVIGIVLISVLPIVYKLFTQKEETKA
ncbi:MAG: hypothetical protein C4K58_04715 [Flavobacteriaceae bacterium]|nr:MAG: hypothetical protein C4K58_04715 [Flavobacteriaceae bacterium]